MPAKYVYEENTVQSAGLSLTGGGTVTLEKDAYIFPGIDVGLVLDASPWTVTIDGTIFGNGGAGIGFGGPGASPVAKNSHLTVGAEGTIWMTSAGAVAVVADRPTDVINSGVIRTEGASAISFIGFAPGAAKSFSVTNNAGAEIYGGISSAISDELMTVKNQGSIIGGISWHGATVITNTGTITGALIGDATATTANTLTNSGSISGNVTLSDGNDVVKNTGSILGTLTLNDGHNSVTNGGTVLSAVAFGTAADTMINTGILYSTVSFSDGTNMLTNGGAINGDVSFGSGNDTITNTGFLFGSVAFGDGVNKLTNAGRIDGNVTFGSADDTVTNTKTIQGILNLGDGNNTLTNGGYIGVLLLGSGDDVLKNNGTVGTTVLLGAGDDSYTGGSGADSVADEAGDDIYKLGAGNDALYLTGASNFTADGGTGFDLLDASNMSSGWVINLDTKAVTLDGVIRTASSAFAAGTQTGGTIKGFENVAGSSDTDFIIGGSGADTLSGAGGDDVLAGGLGADTLYGNGGADDFIYLTAKDSGTTRLTEDKIMDFEGATVAGGDVLSLGALDANSKIAGDQGFTWIGRNVAFGLHPGELRAMTQGTDLVVQGDVNGDGKVDFAVTLVGISDINSGDIVL